jgi:NAD(P)H-nitrite reductase large subunit
LDREQLICVCQDVTAGEIVDAILEHGCLEEVKRCTRACVTCLGCEMEVEELYERYGPQAAPSPASIGVPAMGGAASRG